MYRKFPIKITFLDRDTGRLMQTEGMINLADVGSYEKYPYDTFEDLGEHTTLYFTGNKAPLTIKMKQSDFEKIYDDFINDNQLMDDRSYKKKVKYNGPMKGFHTNTRRFIVSTFYPTGYLFRHGQSEREMQDAILLNEIRPMS